jgi:hypothetical protein
MSVFLAMLVKPLVALLILVPALLLARVIQRHLPDGRLKRLLFSPLPGHKSRRH